ncbi:hypothetical protein HDU98_003783, partial [Podochytrium sp. JEL0797]
MLFKAKILFGSKKPANLYVVPAWTVKKPRQIGAPFARMCTTRTKCIGCKKLPPESALVASMKRSHRYPPWPTADKTAIPPTFFIVHSARKRLFPKTSYGFQKQISPYVLIAWSGWWK